MAIAFRVIVAGMRAEEREAIVFSCEIQRSVDDGPWSAIKGAPDEVAVPLSAVLAVLEAGESEAEKRQSLLELFKTTVRGLPLLSGLVAVDAMGGLLPNGFPVTVNL